MGHKTLKIEQRKPYFNCNNRGGLRCYRCVITSCSATRLIFLKLDTKSYSGRSREIWKITWIGVAINGAYQYLLDKFKAVWPISHVLFIHLKYFFFIKTVIDALFRQCKINEDIDLPTVWYFLFFFVLFYMSRNVVLQITHEHQDELFICKQMVRNYC